MEKEDLSDRSDVQLKADFNWTEQSKSDSCDARPNDNKSKSESQTNTKESNQTAKESDGEKKAQYTVHVAIRAGHCGIDQGDSVLPSRRRKIPSRYRDYEDPDYIPDPDDEDYQPPVRLPGSGRGRGRPRKNAADAVTQDDNALDKQDSENQTPSSVLSDYKSERGQRKLSRNRTESKNNLYKQRPFRCLEEGCGQTFITANWLNRHREQKHQGSSRKDDKAEEEIPREKTSSKKSYNCPTCNKSFTLQGNLKTHMRSHSGEKEFGCDLCSKSFSSADSLKRHKMSHLGIKPYECDECMAKFTSNVALREHKLIHRDLKPYQCSMCNRIFRQISVYQRHMLTHKGEMKFKCEVCGRRFMQKIYLRSHMKKHTGERPYKCDLCEKRFAHASDKARHQKTHSGEKPYSCSVCQARFTDPSSCRRHMKEHSGVLPYSCDRCNEKFKRKISLRAHMTRQHGSDVADQTVVVSGSGVDVANVDLCMIGDNKLVLVGPDGHQLPVVTQMLYADGDQQLVKLVDDKVELKVDESAVLAAENGPSADRQAVLTAAPADTDGGEVLVSGDVKEEEPLSASARQMIQEIGDQLGTQDAILRGADGQQVHVAYHVIHDDEHHIVEIQYQPVEELADGGQVVVYRDPDGKPPAKESEDDVSGQNSANAAAAVDGKMATLDDAQTSGRVSFVGGGGNYEHRYAQDVDACTTLNVQLAGSGVLGSESGSRSENGLALADAGMIPPSEGALRSEMLAGVPTGAGQDADKDELVRQQAAVENVLTSELTRTYIEKPDFGRQEYYNWLSVFNDQCKQTQVPLSEETFRNISQLHKTLTDVMASPSGILAHKDNFRILMSISRDLSSVINEHLMCVLRTLENDT